MRVDTAISTLRLRTWAERGARRASLFVWAALMALASLLAMQVFRGSVLYERWVQDVFIHLNGILHINAGDPPHVGCSTPIGAFYYLAHYLTTYFAPLSAFTAVYANGMVAGLSAGLSVLAGHQRLRGGWLALLTLYVGIVALSPRHLGDMFISFNASYNRWGWAIFAVLAVVISLPRFDAERPRAAVMDGLLSAILIGLLFFTKATYAVVGLGLVFISILTVRRRSQPWLYLFVTGGAIVLLILAVELKFGIVLPYIGDLQRVAQAQEGNRLYQLVMIGYITGGDLVLILLISAIAFKASGANIPFGGIIYLLALIAAGLALATQNNMAAEIPLIPVMALIGFQMFSGRIRWSEMRTLSPAALGAAVLLLFLRPMVADSRTILKESWAASSPGPDVDWLQTTPLKDLAFRGSPNAVVAANRCSGLSPAFEGDRGHLEEDREYLSILQDGIRLLNEHRSGDARVLSFTWTNPFPVLLGSRPVRHELSWWDPGRTFNASLYPQPELLFEGVDFVMIPKVDYFSKTPHLMLRIYGAELKRRYRLLGETGCWRLMGAVPRV